MPETLLSVSAAAALLEIGERAVRKNALAGRYGSLQYVDSENGGGKNRCQDFEFHSGLWVFWFCGLGVSD